MKNFFRKIRSFIFDICFKLFNYANISYLKVFILAIISGVVTGILSQLPVFDNTSISCLEGSVEFWIFMEFIIILNCKNSKESAIKTFLFFLISQPLFYFCKMFFTPEGFRLFVSNKDILMLSLLSLPFGFITWYVKKNNIFSFIIYLLINSYLAFELSNHFYVLYYNFPYQLISIIFILIEILLFTTYLFSSKIKKIILWIITLFIVLLGFYYNYDKDMVKKSTYMELSSELEYSIVSYDNGIDVWIDKNRLYASSSEYGTYKIIMSVDGSESREYTLYYNRDKMVIVKE